MFDFEWDPTCEINQTNANHVQDRHSRSEPSITTGYHPKNRDTKGENVIPGKILGQIGSYTQFRCLLRKNSVGSSSFSPSSLLFLFLVEVSAEASAVV
jgi:hypothetical protein